MGAVRASRGKSVGGHPLFDAILQDMHNKKKFEFENEGQRHEVQQSHWYHSMVNINIYKSNIRFGKPCLKIHVGVLYVLNIVGVNKS